MIERFNDIFTQCKAIQRSIEFMEFLCSFWLSFECFLLSADSFAEKE